MLRLRQIWEHDRAADTARDHILYFRATRLSRKLEAQYSARLVLAYKLAALSVAGLSLFWCLFFVVAGNWILAPAQLVLAIVCAISWLLAERGYFTRALLLSQLVFLVFILALCLMFDVPSETVPRVSHLFLPVLAMLGYLNFKRAPSGLQLGLIGTCIVAFVVLASTNYALPFAEPIAEEVRVFGAWMNAAAAALMLAGCIYVFQLELERSDHRVNALRAALWNREFEVFYQPQVDRNGETIGAEALLRWKPDGRGYVPPAEFIPQAEEAGLMSEIGAFVLETACRTLVGWSQHAETRHLTLSVNVSASQFHEEDFETSVVQMVERFKIDPRLLTIELTESVMVENTEMVATKMAVLRSIGIDMSLDDFGTGYSSLTYLRRLPLTQIKIDRSFVQDIIGNERNGALVRSIIQLGHDLELSILAEGVETQEQFVFLRDGGCQEFQGYLFGRPVPLAEFERGLLSHAA